MTNFDDIDPDALKQYIAAYNLFDKEQKGHIGVEEFAEVTKSIGMDQDEKELNNIIETIGKDGMVTQNQFVAVMTGKTKNADTEQDVLRAFQCFDPEDTGFIDGAELQRIIPIFTDMLKPEEVTAMLNDAGMKDDKKVPYKDFVKKLFTFE